jgi:hypothetical protein
MFLIFDFSTSQNLQAQPNQATTIYISNVTLLSVILFADSGCGLVFSLASGSFSSQIVLVLGWIDTWLILVWLRWYRHLKEPGCEVGAHTQVLLPPIRLLSESVDHDFFMEENFSCSRLCTWRSLSVSTNSLFMVGSWNQKSETRETVLMIRNWAHKIWERSIKGSTTVSDA